MITRVWPDYGCPGHPNMDPYYLSPAEESELIAEQEAEEEARRIAETEDAEA